MCCSTFCPPTLSRADSEGNEGESDDDGDDDVDDDADESPDKSSSESDMVLESCEGLDDIPHPLERDFQVRQTTLVWPAGRPSIPACLCRTFFGKAGLRI